MNKQYAKMIKIAVKYKEAFRSGKDPYRATAGMTVNLKVLIAGRKLGRDQLAKGI